MLLVDVGVVRKGREGGGRGGGGKLVSLVGQAQVRMYLFEVGPDLFGIELTCYLGKEIFIQNRYVVCLPECKFIVLVHAYSRSIEQQHSLPSFSFLSH